LWGAKQDTRGVLSSFECTLVDALIMTVFVYLARSVFLHVPPRGDNK
jgi:hypothetical protein